MIVLSDFSWLMRITQQSWTLTPWPAVPHFTAYPFTPQYRTLPHFRTYFVLYRIKHVIFDALTRFLYHWNQKSYLNKTLSLNVTLRFLVFFRFISTRKTKENCTHRHSVKSVHMMRHLWRDVATCPRFGGKYFQPSLRRIVCYVI